LAAIKKADASITKEEIERREKIRDTILSKYDLKASTATVPDETKEGEGDGEEAGAAYISASAAIVVLGAMLQ